MSLRVFAPSGAPALVEGARLDLDADESHYLLRVRRATVGAPVEVMDGQRLRRATLAAVEGRTAVLTIDTASPEVRPAPPPVTVVLGLTDSQAALAAITNACAAGAASIALATCERSPGHAPSPARIERVIRAAQRQCGRPAAPSITGPAPLSRALSAAVSPGTRPGYVARAPLAGTPGAGIRPCGPEGACLLIGPEGGLTDDEARRAADAGLAPVSLGPWTLRTEIAVVAGLGQLLIPQAVPPKSMD